MFKTFICNPGQDVHQKYVNVQRHLFVIIDHLISKPWALTCWLIHIINYWQIGRFHWAHQAEALANKPIYI